MKYFNTKTRLCKDETKQNVVIMGRQTYFGIPEQFRPLRNRINYVLTTNPEQFSFPDSVKTFPNLTTCMEFIETSDVRDKIENIWIVGGAGVYEEAMKSSRCNRVYLTDVMADFECDTFFPEIPADFIDVSESEEQCKEINEENGVKYQFKIFQKQ